MPPDVARGVAPNFCWVLSGRSRPLRLRHGRPSSMPRPRAVAIGAAAAAALLSAAICNRRLQAGMSYWGLFIPEPHVSFVVVWFAQVIGSFGQPLILNNVVCIPSPCSPCCHPAALARPTALLRSLSSPIRTSELGHPRAAQARLAGDWFPINERDMAVTVSVVARSVRLSQLPGNTQSHACRYRRRVPPSPPPSLRLLSPWLNAPCQPVVAAPLPAAVIPMALCALPTRRRRLSLPVSTR